jgi:hypothetical protein
VATVVNLLFANAAQRREAAYPEPPCSFVHAAPMSFESLTYADLADRLGTTSEAARALVRRLKLPRQPGNDGKVRITVDLAELEYRPLPARSPAGHRADIDALKARIEALQSELSELEAENSTLRSIANGHRADFERERERSDTLLLEIVRFTAAVLSAREKAARLEGELSACRARSWSRRIAGLRARTARSLAQILEVRPRPTAAA